MIKKRILPVVMILAAFLLQTTVFQSIKLAGAVPNLLLVLTITYGYLRGRTSGLVIGFFSGLLLDCLYGSVIGLYAFIFMTILFISFCRKYFIQHWQEFFCLNWQIIWKSQRKEKERRYSRCLTVYWIC